MMFKEISPKILVFGSDSELFTYRLLALTETRGHFMSPMPEQDARLVLLSFHWEQCCPGDVGCVLGGCW